MAGVQGENDSSCPGVFLGEFPNPSSLRLKLSPGKFICKPRGAPEIKALCVICCLLALSAPEPRLCFPPCATCMRFPAALSQGRWVGLCVAASGQPSLQPKLSFSEGHVGGGGGVRKDPLFHELWYGISQGVSGQEITGAAAPGSRISSWWKPLGLL